MVMSVLVYFQLKRSSTESNFESWGTNQTWFVRLFLGWVCKTLCFDRILDSMSLEFMYSFFIFIYFFISCRLPGACKSGAAI
jgi:hypothetical protein